MVDSPAVMVSSTFYDLQQIRADLRQFLQDDLGYRPLLSELASFPVDPDQNTVENSKRRAAEADILVLVIGGRYGSIDLPSNKSVTNLEYLEARARGIPIYAFVKKEVLHILPTWTLNPDADYRNVVDSPSLFEFVQLVRSADRVWTFEFEVAADITSVLRNQLAFLFSQSLQTHRRTLRIGSRSIDTLRGESLRLALEKPEAWEYLLLFHSWLDEVDARRNQIREYELAFRFGDAENVPLFEVVEWLQTRIHELQNVVGSLNRLVNESMNSVVGSDGQDGDIDSIVWASNAVGSLLDQALNWARRVRSARVDEVFDQVMVELSLFPNSIVERLQSFPNEAIERIHAALASARTPGADPQHIELRFVITLDNVDAYSAAFAEAERRLTGGG